jgi:hypothetical protein
MLAVVAQNMLRKVPVALALRQIHPATGEMSGVLRLNDERSSDAFTFEKISPPRRGPIAPIVKKQRGLVVAILDRFVEARVKRDEKRVITRAKPKT